MFARLCAHACVRVYVCHSACVHGYITLLYSYINSDYSSVLNRLGKVSLGLLNGFGKKNWSKYQSWRWIGSVLISARIAERVFMDSFYYYHGPGHAIAPVSP